jgi:hypothetical protein
MAQGLGHKQGERLAVDAFRVPARTVQGSSARNSMSILAFLSIAMAESPHFPQIPR